MNKSISPRNDKGEQHGYWEVYYYNDGDLMYKCLFHNGKEVGYEEYYTYNGKLTKKKYNL